MNSSALIEPTDSPRSRRAQTLQHLKARRKRWLRVHLWLGLSLGLFLAIIGLTGSILVFWQEIDEALNPQLYRTSTSPGTPRSLDEMAAVAKQTVPAGWDSFWALVPEDTHGNYVFGFYYPNISPPPEQVQSISVGIDPYTAEVSHKRVFYHGSNPMKHSFVGFLFKLHYALLLGETGGTLVGIMAVLFVISVLTGLILWWPLTGNWRRVLTIKRRASSARFNHDLHQSAGLYSLIVLLAVLVSGMYFNLPDQFSWLVERFSPLTPEVQVSLVSNRDQVSVEEALQRVRKDYSGGKPRYYTFNSGERHLFTACYKDVPELQDYVLAERCLVLNTTDGNLVQVKDAAHGSGGDVFMQWQWPLHSGQVFGWTGRILVFIAGLVCPLLFVTGVIRWLQKRRARRVVNGA